MRNHLWLLVLSSAACQPSVPLTGQSVEGLSQQMIRGTGLPPQRIILTYDDGPGRNTLDIASFLHQQGIPATFFVNGCHFWGHPAVHPNSSQSCQPSSGAALHNYPEYILGQLVNYEHHLGSHAQDHLALGQHPTSLVLSQLSDHQEVIDRWQPHHLQLFRPPHLSWNYAHNTAVENLFPEVLGPFGHDLINQSGGLRFDSGCLRQQGLSPNAGALCAMEYLQAISTFPVDRGILLMHDREVASENRAGDRSTYDFTVALVQGLRALGFVFVPLDAVPGVLGPHRMHSPTLWTSAFSDSSGWASRASYYGSLRLADVDGDGDQDLCGRGAAGIYCALANNSSAGFAAPTLWVAGFSSAQGWSADRYGTTLMFADLDNDGDDDVCARGPQGIWCARSRAKYLGPGPALLSHSFEQPTLWTSNYSDSQAWGNHVSYYGSLRLGDVDRDGRADICGRGAQGIFCARSNGNTFNQWVMALSNEFSDAKGWRAEKYGATLMMGDINGDGRADICGRGVYGVSCAIAKNNGTMSFDKPSLWIKHRFSNGDAWSSDAGKYLSLRLADVDGDGNADICGRNDTGVACAFSNRYVFKNYLHLQNQYFHDADPTPSSARPYGTTFQLGDVTGDGLADACLRGPGGVRCAVAADKIRY